MIPSSMKFKIEIPFILTGPFSGTTVARRRASLSSPDFPGSQVSTQLDQEQRGLFARTKSPLRRLPTLARWFGVR